MTYIWQLSNWSNFEYDLDSIQDTLYLYAKVAGEVIGGFRQIQENDQNEALLDIIASEALKTSEIEGELYKKEDVRSSLRNHLGLSKTIEQVKDKRAASISKLMIHTRKAFDRDLTIKDLCDWHKILMEGQSNIDLNIVGKWRESCEPMQIISGAYGRERVHYEAPPSHLVPQEMGQFIDWFNKTRPSSENILLPGPIRSSIAHFYFECIHPFEDGNGRIGRAISEKALSQDLGRPVLLSISNEIMKKKGEYYAQLSRASKGSQDISEWICYFTTLIYKAQLSTKELIDFVLFKSRFWREKGQELNERQEKVLKRMFKEGPQGSKGGMSAAKYMKLTDSSKATATRDLTDLLKKGCLIKQEAGGRSTHYDLPCFADS